MIIYMESYRDFTRIKVWEFHQAHLDFWEEGRVQLRKLAHEDYKVTFDALLNFFQIVISVKRGDIQDGYVAIDDFIFQSSDQEEFCTIKPSVGTATPFIYCFLTRMLGHLPPHQKPQLQLLLLQPFQTAHLTGKRGPVAGRWVLCVVSNLSNPQVHGLKFSWSIESLANLTGHDTPINEHEGYFLYVDTV